MQPSPPAGRPGWQAMALVALFGGIFGLGGLTFLHAGGQNYLFDDPRTCANCHVMQDYYDSWARSSHHTHATCNDCHVPHDVLMHWAIKGYDGLNHSYHFTVGDYPTNIQITQLSADVVREDCVECHKSMVNHIVAVGNTQKETVDCIVCHRHVGH